MTTLRAIFADPIRPSELAMWRRILSPVGCHVETPSSVEMPELERLVVDADVLLVRRRSISADLIARAERLKLIQKIGLIPEHVDVSAARDRGIRVATAFNPSWVGVAEHTMLLMLAVSKQLHRADAAVQSGQNPAGVPSQPTTETKYAYNWAQLEPLRLLHRKRLGLVGFGEIGQLVAQRAQSFGMTVRYFRRRGPARDALVTGCAWQPLDDLLREADYVSLHVPFTADTAGLIGQRELSLLKPSAYLINTARGGVVYQDALVEALSARRFAGAGLDVFRDEPLSVDDPLSRLDNVILTPHNAAIRPETMEDPFPEIVANVQQLAAGSLTTTASS